MSAALTRTLDEFLANADWFDDPARSKEHSSKPPVIIVDDILRSGRAIQETFQLCKEIGAEVIGCGVIAKFEDAANEIDGIPVKSLLSFDVNFYETEKEWKSSRSASDEAEEEKVRF